jgi:cyclopropane fatty-acyl-phospholipid synthase-like methyltransferase
MKLLRTIIARQFRRPSGPLGHFASAFMRKNNQEHYRHVVELLQVHDDDVILEVGCGEGLAIRLIAEQCPKCKTDGIDFSRLMLRKAARSNSIGVGNGNVRLLFGDLRDYDFAGTAYSKIFAINVLYFWKDLGAVFSKLHQLLKPEGRLVLFMSSPERLNQVPFAVDGIFNKYSVEQVQYELRQSGFGDIGCETGVKQGLATYYLSASKK